MSHKTSGEDAAPESLESMIRCTLKDLYRRRSELQASISLLEKQLARKSKIKTKKITELECAKAYDQ